VSVIWQRSLPSHTFAVVLLTATALGPPRAASAQGSYLAMGLVDRISAHDGAPSAL
jgi:hypothetical protein